MAPVFQIQLDDPQEYHVGGEPLTGKLLLAVNGSHTLSLKDVILRVICEIETSVEAKPDPKGRTKTQRGSMRLFDGEMVLPLPTRHFAPGRHEIPFRYPLPADRPRLPPTATDVVRPSTFGHITYTLKAQAHKSVSSWFSSGEIKAFETFMFMPPSTLTDEHNNAPAMRQQVMSGYVGGAASEAAQSNSFWSRLTGSSSKLRKEPPLEVQCYLNEPTTGLAQDRTTQFQLRVVSSNPDEPIMVQSVSLTLETIVTLVANGLRVMNQRASQSLLQAKVLRSGAEVDLSDILNAVEIRTAVLPTFQTPLITYNYALVVQVKLVRAHHHRGESADIVQRLPIRVLSPYIVDKLASAAEVAAADSANVTPGHEKSDGLLAAAPSVPQDVSTEYPPEKSQRVPSNPQLQPVRKPVPGLEKQEIIYGSGTSSAASAVPGSSSQPGPSTQSPSRSRPSSSGASPSGPTPGPSASENTSRTASVASVPAAVDEQPPSEPPPAYSE